MKYKNYIKTKQKQNTQYYAFIHDILQARTQRWHVYRQREREQYKQVRNKAVTATEVKTRKHKKKTK